MAKTKLVDIDPVYIKEYLASKGISNPAAGQMVRRSSKFISSALNRRRIDEGILAFLCSMTGMDEERAKTIPQKKQKEEPKEEPQEKAADDALMLHTEMVVSYMQDLGKIQTDTLRELRELRHEQKELITKLTAELHELNVYIKNDAPASKGQRTAINNNLSMILNYIQKKGEQQCRK